MKRKKIVIFFIFFCVALAVVIFMSLFSKPAEAPTPKFKGPTGQPFVKGPSGPPPAQ